MFIYNILVFMNHVFWNMGAACVLEAYRCLGIINNYIPLKGVEV